MSKPLWILGAGGHAKVAADIALASDPERQIAYFDDGQPIGHHVLSGTVAGTLDNCFSMLTSSVSVFVALGHNQLRQTLIQRLLASGIEPVNLIHPTVILANGVEIGCGTMLAAGAIINPDTRIGNGCIINTNTSVDHDCDIGDFVHIAPGSAIAGGVNVGEGSFLGIGTRVIPGVSIGKWAIIGAGAVVIDGVIDKTTVVGIPAKVKRKIVDR